ncbi:IclR family transcriptional regulator [Paenibacillus antri]|uniref:Glycerol operon regulatory protein n=1 Tax=Paenibacillus antri TaxID=2582848 RepID=A0A5R9GCP6_9BACL|nr:IclR family transcriptional regulator [Paenibacillus antri]TLS51860.1 IclR family transcriptional regulator [Paenibacillus antri]
MEEDVKVKSLFRALKIMDCFSLEKPEWGITELSQHLGFYKSNVSNIVTTFVKAGYLEQNEDNGKYRLGFKILQLGNIISSNISFRKLMIPYMQEIADKVNEIVYLAVPYEGEVIYLDSCLPKNQLSTRSMLGVKAPLHCTGIGKAMLSVLPEETVSDVISRGLKKFTDNTITNPELLLQELAETRERGYSLDRMEHEYGIKCIGMPILNKRKQLIAAISVSGPSLRFDEEKIRELSSLLKQAVTEIENKL